MSIALIVGVADVFVTLRLEAGFWETDPVEMARTDRPSGSRFWELPDVPTTPSVLRAEMERLCRECGCEEALTLRVVPVIAEELIRAVTNARGERDRRLSLCPVAAAVEWGEINDAPRRRYGNYASDSAVVEVTITYHIEMTVGGTTAGVLLICTTAGRRRTAEFAVSLDGICSDGVVQTLETWGWPPENALAVGRAVAIRARADWLAMHPL